MFFGPFPTDPSWGPVRRTRWKRINTAASAVIAAIKASTDSWFILARRANFSGKADGPCPDPPAIA